MAQGRPSAGQQDRAVDPELPRPGAASPLPAPIALLAQLRMGWRDRQDRTFKKNLRVRVVTCWVRRRVPGRLRPVACRSVIVVDTGSCTRSLTATTPTTPPASAGVATRRSPLIFPPVIAEALLPHRPGPDATSGRAFGPGQPPVERQHTRHLQPGIVVQSTIPGSIATDLRSWPVSRPRAAGSALRLSGIEAAANTRTWSEHSRAGLSGM